MISITEHPQIVGTPHDASARDREGRLQALSIWRDFLASDQGKGDVAMDRWAGLVGAWITDACLVADAEALERGLEALQQAYSDLEASVLPSRRAGIITALAEVMRAASDRAYQVTWERTVDAQSWAAQMLLVIADHPGIASAEVLRRLRVHKATLSETQVSRSGRTLLERGLATVSQLGRSAVWRITPRGLRATSALRKRIATLPVVDTPKPRALSARGLEVSYAPPYATWSPQQLVDRLLQPGKPAEPPTPQGSRTIYEASDLSLVDITERNVSTDADVDDWIYEMAL